MELGRRIRTVEIVEEPEPANERVEEPTLPEPDRERVPA